MLKPLRSLFLLFLLKTSLMAQSQLALNQGNYNSVFALHSNPASIVDSRYSTYIQLASVDIHYANNFFSTQHPSFSQLIKNQWSVPKETEFFNKRANYFSNGFDAKGLTVVQKINRKNAVSLFTRMRGTQQINKAPHQLYDFMVNGKIQQSVLNNTKLNSNTQLFHEIGLGYGRVIFDYGESFLKAGLNVKLLTGIYHAGITGKAIFGKTTTSDNGKEGLELSQGTLNLRHFGEKNLQNLNFFNFDYKNWFKTPLGNGVGFDLGFTYEIRPDHGSIFVKRKSRSRNGKHANEISPVKYKWRFNAALTDFGKIRFQNDSVKSYTIDLKEKQFGSEIDGAFQYNDLFRLTDTDKNKYEKSFSAFTPAALQVSADYKVNSYFFLNFAAQQSLLPRTWTGARAVSYAAFTPRIEKKYLEVALPVAMTNNYKSFQLGTAVRIGPLMLGTDNLIGATSFLKNNNGANFYVGLHWGFLEKMTYKQKIMAARVPAHLPKGQKVPPKIPKEYNKKGIKNNGDDDDNTFNDDDTENEILTVKGDNKVKPEAKNPLTPPANMENIERFASCISFYYEKNTLKSPAYTCLGEMCKYYTKNKNITLRIIGCMLPTERSTEPEKLKMSRARQIRNYLIQSGFPASQITIVADKRPNHTQAVVFQKTN